MLISNLITHKSELLTVKPTDLISKALEVINKNNLLSIPVIDDDKYYGYISKEIIFSFQFEKNIDKKSLISDFKVEELMKSDLPIASPWDGVEQVVSYLEHKHIPFVPIIGKYDSFNGIVTHHAVFHQFNEIFGVNKGEKLSVVAFDIPGQISKISRIISENNGDILSFVVIDPKTAIDVKEIVVRLVSEDFDKIVKEIKKAGFQVQD
ncbi:CBS domain-containing protein [Clostridium hydrogenum]|uniref:CBS domain-containing protein n=1 Tax=Clostridium hydrogenum TaxID=2855764 RepID=UPI001F3C865B|nr:CBS domain-containing protein [Clostridium hydrogenum]